MPQKIYLPKLGMWADDIIALVNSDGSYLGAFGTTPSQENRAGGSVWLDSLGIWSGKVLAAVNPDGTPLALTSDGSAVIVDDTPPAEPLTDGQLWWDSSTGNLYVWYVDDSGQWVQTTAAVVDPNSGQYTILPDSNSDAASTIPSGVDSVVIPAVTTNANDWLVLSVPVVGMRIRGWSVVAHEIRTVASSNVTINNVDADGTNEAAIPATTYWEATCVTSTAWILRAWDELGAPITAIVPHA